MAAWEGWPKGSDEFEKHQALRGGQGLDLFEKLSLNLGCGHLVVSGDHSTIGPDSPPLGGLFQPILDLEGFASCP